MTSCNDIDLIAYLEGEDPAGKVSGHLETCPSCRKDLAAYRKLIGGLIQSRQILITDCSEKKNFISAVINKSVPDREHLDKCVSCRELYDVLVDVFQDIEDKADSAAGPLPEKVLEQIAIRKKKWVAGRLDKVIEFHGEKSKSRRDEQIQKLLNQDLDELPKAAFPDDLTREDEEDED